MTVMQLLLSLLTTLIIIFISPTLGTTQKGFTTRLITRDSPLSPNYNASDNKWESLRRSFQRSISRVSHLRRRLSTVAHKGTHAEVRGAGGSHVMEVSIGTPPVRQLWIVDTGSDLMWTQCQPCLKCFKQDLPIFDPKNSSSYKVQSCESKSCKSLSSQQYSCSQRGTCQYLYAYGDSSQSMGDVVSESLTFDDAVSFAGITFGCGHYNVGSFSESESGLIGLGGGPLSLISQLNSSIGGKFSYCLIPLFEEGNSTINFGTNAVVSGPDVVSTPLVKKTSNTYYFLTLEGISVEKTRIPFINNKLSYSLGDDNRGQEGNIVIDSGTTLNFLPTNFYNKLTKVLIKVIHGIRVDDPSGILKLCYRVANDLHIPNITAHFTGADIVLKPINTFVLVQDDVICLAMLPTQNVALFGNIAQSNFLVGYDIEGGKVSFKPVDCTKVNK